MAAKSGYAGAPYAALSYAGTDAALSVSAAVTAAQTLPAATQSGTVELPHAATAAQTLPATTQAGVGVEGQPGAGIQTLPATNQAGVGVMLPSVAGVQMLPSTIQTGTAVVVAATATAAQTVPAATQAAVGTLVPSGSGVQILSSTIQAGAGVQGQPGVGAETLPSLAQVGVGVHTEFVPDAVVVAGGTAWNLEWDEYLDDAQRAAYGLDPKKARRAAVTNAIREIYTEEPADFAPGIAKAKAVIEAKDRQGHLVDGLLADAIALRLVMTARRVSEAAKRAQMEDDDLAILLLLAA